MEECTLPSAERVPVVQLAAWAGDTRSQSEAGPSTPQPLPSHWEAEAQGRLSAEVKEASLEFRFPASQSRSGLGLVFFLPSRDMPSSHY